MFVFRMVQSILTFGKRLDSNAAETIAKFQSDTII